MNLSGYWRIFNIEGFAQIDHHLELRTLRRISNLSCSLNQESRKVVKEYSNKINSDLRYFFSWNAVRIISFLSSHVMSQEMNSLKYSVLRNKSLKLIHKYSASNNLRITIFLYSEYKLLLMKILKTSLDFEYSRAKLLLMNSHLSIISSLYLLSKLLFINKSNVSCGFVSGSLGSISHSNILIHQSILPVISRFKIFSNLRAFLFDLVNNSVAKVLSTSNALNIIILID